MMTSLPLFRIAAASAISITLLLLPGPAQAKIEFSWSGMIRTDIRFRINDISVGRWYDKRPAEPGVSRNDNLFRFKLIAESGRFAGVAEFDFSYYGFAADLESFDQLYRQEVVDAFRIEARSAYIEARDLFVEGLDLRIGQQVIAWGVGDQFNPTNVINAPDIEDPLLFGEQLANVMVKLDYSRDGNFVFSGVMVPIFRPALLVRTAGLGLAFSERLPFTNAALRYRVHTENWFIAKSGYPTVVEGAQVITPDFSPENIQWAARVAGNIGGQDLALMFYYGRSPIPQSVVSVARLDKRRRCNPIRPGECIDGTIATTSGLYFPRFLMLGLNAAGELPNPLSLISKKIKGLGYRLEVGLFFPQPISSAVMQKEIAIPAATLPAGEYRYPGGIRPRAVEDRPFLKWSLGLDYTFTSNIYLNVQWVHGLVDEFGAGSFFRDGDVVRAGFVDTDVAPTLEGNCSLKVLNQNTGGGDQDFSPCVTEILKPRINDYLVLGVDLKFLDQKMLLRLFVIWDLIGVYEERWDPQAASGKGARTRQRHGPLTAKGFSAVIFPELTYNFGKGFELSAGALLNLGKVYSKFGDPAAGGQQIWTRARFTF